MIETVFSHRPAWSLDTTWKCLAATCNVFAQYAFHDEVPRQLPPSAWKLAVNVYFRASPEGLGRCLTQCGMRYGFTFPQCSRSQDAETYRGRRMSSDHQFYGMRRPW